ncbi:TrkH family potassium uptake protein [Bradyrhizobium icense]|uniref:Ktr system potassium transporter B n=1 Tax=Bradyrhizobium icense TaxID=1274631 RepID=A0A1B1UL83_9BRAD|nr:potassium transporter TrkG [Bradyrhizobium icense]ANW03519.1 Ktr system potassium transporter B [Bradyrhizobium icense]
MPLKRLIDRLPPPLVLCFLYIGLVVFGAVLLKLGAGFATTRPITWSDAVFTATSAITVTGLAVVDTGSDLTLFGQAIVACLIQIGGIGIITFSVLMLRALGMPIGFQHKIYLRDDLNRTSIHDVLVLAWQVLRISLLAEVLGAIVLAYVWIPEMGRWQGIWYAVFHSVSAFNNAGFGLHSASMTPWAGSWIVILTISLLFVIGGLGYGVIDDIAARRTWWALTLHSKLTLAGTAALLLWGTVAFAVLEWSNPDTLGSMTVGEKLLSSWFQGVTPRTAGFNSIDFAKVQDGTSLLTITLMIIGGGSTSAAGGIKVSSFLVMVLACVSFVRKESQVSAFGRGITLDDVTRVFSLIVLTGTLIVTATFFVLVTHDAQLLDVLFEVTSALGTVGLSRGLTAQLNEFGRVIIVLLMLAGKLGPLTLALLFMAPRVGRSRYATGKVYIG